MSVAWKPPFGREPKSQKPNPEPQRSSRLQIPNASCHRPIPAWSLKLGICLGFGSWPLELLSPLHNSSLRQFLLQRALHMRRHKGLHVAAEPRDFLDDARAQERVGLLRHHEDRFDPLVELTVH